MPEVDWCADPYEAITDVDAMVILTEWNVFRGLDLERARTLMRQPVIIDLRNIFEPQQVSRLGFSYTCIGRPVAGLPAE